MRKYRFILAAALALATTASGARGDEDSVVAALEKLGAEVQRDESRPGKPAVKVVLATGPVTDAGLKGLAELKQLRSLTISSCRVTGAGLKDLAALTKLRELNLGNNRHLTGAGLKDLAALKQLRELNVFSTDVTAAGVAELKKALPKCQINR